MKTLPPHSIARRSGDPSQVPNARGDAVNPYSRRDFLKLSAGALGVSAVAGACGEEAASSAARTVDRPIGVQLHCVRHQIEEQGLEPNLEALASLGYEGVEFADYHGHSAAELRRMLDDAGLRACGSHEYIDVMLGDELERTLEFHQTIGNDYLIVRWMGEEMHGTREDLLRTCETYNEIAAALKPHGMRIGYHNHGYIFERYEDGGPTKWEIFCDNTIDDVALQLDTGNAASLADPVDLMRRNPGRFATMHIKPWHPEDRDAFIGDDALDWDTIVELTRTSAGLDWYIIEYERDAFPPLESLQANLQNFRKMLAA